MRIIDAHTHIGHKIIVAGPDQLVASMEAAGIDAALVFAGHINDMGTELLLKEIKPYRDRLLPVGVVSPVGLTKVALQQRLGRLEKMLQRKKLAAVKFYTGYEHFFPHGPEPRPFLQLCADYGVPAIFHTGDCYCKIGNALLEYAQPLQLDRLAVQMPQLTIVMAHMGYPWTVTGAEVVYKNKNVFADCSGWVEGAFSPRARARYVGKMQEFIEYVENPEKLMFGSDWPICDQKSYLSATEEALNGESGLTEAVFAGNAARIYGVKT